MLADADLEEAEVDLAEEFTAPPSSTASSSSAAPSPRRFGPGQAVRQAHIKSRQWFAAGDTVKVVATGDGFALESIGQALTNGIEGQPAQGADRERPHRHRRRPPASAAWS